MSIYQPKGSKTWVMDFHFAGQRIRESTKTRSKTLATKKEQKRRRELEEGAAGIRQQQAPRLLSVAATEWLEEKELNWSPKMRTIAKNSLKHLLPQLGKRLLVDLEARDIIAYQKHRLAEGAANRTANIEIGLLRQIMRHNGCWARIQGKVKMLKERDDAGRALSDEEEAMLLLECSRSRSRTLLPFIVVALCTGARCDTVRTLKWGTVDFTNRCLKFGKDKTAAGTNRTVPLNQRALETLKFWALEFPNRLPNHFVFPFEQVGAAGDAFTAKTYGTDPGRPVGTIKKAWEAARRRSRRHCPNCKTGILVDSDKGFICHACNFATAELPAGLTGTRFHDLRHTAVSRMIAAGVPLPLIAKIVGWSAGTMVKMAARYGHFGMEELRGAVEATSRSRNENPVASQQGYPRFSPQSDSEIGGGRPN